MAVMNYDEGLKILYTAMSKLRGYIDDNNAILYLATAYRQGWFENTDNFSDVASLLNLQERLSNTDLLRRIGLQDSFTEICSSLPNEDFFFYNIYRPFEEIELDWWRQYWLQAFDDILSKNATASGKFVGEYLQPKELTRLVECLCEGYGFSSVYNPFAGTGSFCSLVGKGGRYIGQEINSRVHSLGVLRMLANDIEPSNLVLGDSCKQWGEGQQSFDLIVGFPPIGFRYRVTPDMGVEWSTPNIPLTDYFLLRGSESLNPGGRLIAIMSGDYLSKNGASGSLRKRLVNEGRVETVIQLPAGILYGTGVSTCIVVLSDKTRVNNEILFVNASSFVKKEGRLNILQVDELMQSIKSADPRYAALVQREVVQVNDCQLVPFQYLAKAGDNDFSIPDGFEEVPLKELVSLYHPIANNSTRVRIVRGKDLHSAGEIKPTTFEELPVEPIEARRYGRLDRDVILILKIRHLKPTLFEYREDLKVLLSSNVAAFVPNEGVDPYYLVSELRKDYITSQIDSLATGAYIPSLRVNDILTIRVLMPINRGAQHSAFLNAQRIEKEQRLKDLQMNEFIQRERNRINEMMSIRRHRINPYISGLRSNVTMLLDEVYSSGTLDASLELSEGYTVRDALENMDINLAQLKELFDAFTADTSVGEAESIDLISFLKEYTFTATMPDRHFALDKVDPESQDLFLHISFNRSNLKEALDEIIHNAEKHFEPGQKGSKVMLIPRIEGQTVSLLISNNGAPVPMDFDEERSFAAGYHKDKYGTGQGLFRVRQLCDEFGAKIRWENDAESVMPVALRIIFKLSQD